MKLARTQAALYKLIVEADDALPALAAKIVEPAAQLSPLQRVEIYTRQYPARMQEALLGDFPKLAQLIGDDAFWELTVAYARAFPSQEPDLGRFGRELVTFLRSHTHRDARADLADLASLEWARTECFLAADAEPVTTQAMKSLAPEAFVEARLGLIPALRVLDLEHDVLRPWAALEAGKRAPKVREGRASVVVWRKGFAVYHAALGPAEADALRAAKAGKTLGEVMEPFAGEKEGAKAAFQAVASWLNEGMVAAVTSE